MLGSQAVHSLAAALVTGPVSGPSETVRSSRDAELDDDQADRSDGNAPG